MLKVNDKTSLHAAATLTEKRRKKLSFRDPEVEGGASSSSSGKHYIGFLRDSHMCNESYVNDSDGLYHHQSTKPTTAGLVPTKIASPRRQSLIQLQPISSIIKSKSLVNDHKDEDDDSDFNKLSNDQDNFEKRLKVLLEKERTQQNASSESTTATASSAPSPATLGKFDRRKLVHGHQTVHAMESAKHAVIVTPLAAAMKAPLKVQQPEIVIDDVDNCFDDNIEDGRMTSGSLDDVFLESQAMKIARTVGQAFEVVHMINQQHHQPTTNGQKEAISEKCDIINSPGKNKKLKYPADSPAEISRSIDSKTQPEVNLAENQLSNVQHPSRQLLQPDNHNGNDLLTHSLSNSSINSLNTPRSNNHFEPIPKQSDSDNTNRYGSPLGEAEAYSSSINNKSLPSFDNLHNPATPLSTHHQVQLLREQLDQQQQQTQVAIAQVHLLRDQLAAESAARLAVESRIHQLLVQNKELLNHIHRLIYQMQELETKTQGLENKMSPQRYQQQQEFNYLSQMSNMPQSSLPNSYQDYSAIMDSQVVNNMASDQSPLYENHHSPNMSTGLEPPNSPLQMYAPPISPYGTSQFHYTNSLKRNIASRQQQQQTQAPSISANEQLCQLLSSSNPSLFFQQQQQLQRAGSDYYRQQQQQQQTAALLRQMSQQDFMDNYQLPMTTLSLPPQRKRPTANQQRQVNDQRIQLANSLFSNEQMNKLTDNLGDKSD
ncbi:hypothetical protein CHUAL_003528 [Chamberlinius hualienensis]